MDFTFAHAIIITHDGITNDVASIETGGVGVGMFSVASEAK